MARTDRLQGRGVSPLRLVAILLFLVVLTGGMAYLFAMPLRQLYWGGASVLVRGLPGRIATVCSSNCRPSRALT